MFSNLHTSNGERAAKEGPKETSGTGTHWWLKITDAETEGDEGENSGPHLESELGDSEDHWPGLSSIRTDLRSPQLQMVHVEQIKILQQNSAKTMTGNVSAGNRTVRGTSTV